MVNNEEVYDANFLVAHNTYLENSQFEAIVKFWEAYDTPTLEAIDFDLLFAEK